MTCKKSDLDWYGITDDGPVGSLEKSAECPDEIINRLNGIGNPNPISPNEIHAAIKDSGDRTEFDTGAVRDMREGKGRCDLMPLEVVAEYLKRGWDKATDQLTHIVFEEIAKFQKDNDTSHLYAAIYYANVFGNYFTTILEVARHFEEGAKKYGENNWQKGIPANCYIDSAIRHYLKWLRGDKDEPHDRAFVWNLMCCIWEVDYHDKEDT